MTRNIEGDPISSAQQNLASPSPDCVLRAGMRELNPRQRGTLAFFVIFVGAPLISALACGGGGGGDKENPFLDTARDTVAAQQTAVAPPEVQPTIESGIVGGSRADNNNPDLVGERVQVDETPEPVFIPCSGASGNEQLCKEEEITTGNN